MIVVPDAHGGCGFPIGGVDVDAVVAAAEAAGLARVVARLAPLIVFEA